MSSTTIATEKKIDYRFKLVYFFGIVMIVAGHCGGGGLTLFSNWIPFYAFHLGLFTFASGYFFKDHQKAGPYFLKKIRHLIIPLYAYNLVYGVITHLSHRWGFTMGGYLTLENLLIKPITDGSQFEYNIGGWYVIPLFLVEVYMFFIRKLPLKNKLLKEILLFALSLIIGITGVHYASIGYRTGWYLALNRTAYFIPFFGLGVFYKNVLGKYDRLNNVLYFGIILLLELAIMYKYEKLPSYSQIWLVNFVDGPVLPFFVGFLGIAFWFRVSAVLEPALGRSRLVKAVCDSAYSIMINQLAGFMLVKGCFALLAKYTRFCSSFNFEAFKSERWYFFAPKGFIQFYIFYLAAGIGFPILIQMAINQTKKKLFVKNKHC